MTNGHWLKSSVKPKLMWALAFMMSVKPWPVPGEFFGLAFFLKGEKDKMTSKGMEVTTKRQRSQHETGAQERIYHGPTSWPGRWDPFLNKGAGSRDLSAHTVALKNHFPLQGTKNPAEMVHSKSRIHRKRLDSRQLSKTIQVTSKGQRSPLKKLLMAKDGTIWVSIRGTIM